MRDEQGRIVAEKGGAADQARERSGALAGSRLPHEHQCTTVMCNGGGVKDMGALRAEQLRNCKLEDVIDQELGVDRSIVLDQNNAGPRGNPQGELTIEKDLCNPSTRSIAFPERPDVQSCPIAVRRLREAG